MVQFWGAKKSVILHSFIVINMSVIVFYSPGNASRHCSTFLIRSIAFRGLKDASVIKECIFFITAILND